MTYYPMQAVKLLFRAESDGKGFGKDYLFVAVTAANGKSILIRKWGKRGAEGQTKVDTFETAEKMQRTFESEQKKRTSRDYWLESDKNSDNILSDTELKTFLGRMVWPRVGAANLQHLDPCFDITGVKDPREKVAVRHPDGSVTYEYPAKLDRQAIRRREEQAAALKRQQEIEENRKTYESNPVWGMF